jgi:CRP/FNR family transcriptional regulator, cyclic AMP receptor protein
MQTLAQVPFFKDAADLDSSRFDRRCAWRRYRAEEIVVDYEDESSDVYFIVAGEVRVLIRTAAGREIILGDLKVGQFFGELAAIDGAKRSANVTALTSSEICIMPANVFREIIFSSSTICERVLRLLTGRVRELTARVTEHSVFDLKHRLYSELLRMAHPRLGRPAQRALAPPPCIMFSPRVLAAGASRLHGNCRPWQTKVSSKKRAARLSSCSRRSSKSASARPCAKAAEAGHDSKRLPAGLIAFAAFVFEPDGHRRDGCDDDGEREQKPKRETEDDKSGRRSKRSRSFDCGITPADEGAARAALSALGGKGQQWHEFARLEPRLAGRAMRSRPNDRKAARQAVAQHGSEAAEDQTGHDARKETKP